MTLSSTQGWLSALPVGVVVVDPGCRIVFVNAACAALCNGVAERMTGVSLERLVGEAARIALDPLIAQARRGEASSGEVTIGSGDGRRRVRVRFVAAPTADGTPDVVGTFVELPAGWIADRPALASAVGASSPGSDVRTLERFLTFVAHELRSPLNAIHSWSFVLDNQLQAAGAVAPLAARALAGIHSGVERQTALIERLFDATIALTGALRLSLSSVNVREVLAVALADAGAKATAKGIAIQVDLRLADEHVHGDAERIRAVFADLLSNALECSPRGGEVWLSARRDGREATIVVKDSGRGLASGHEAWLFEPFMRVDGPDGCGSHDLGLGLALAWKVVAAHHGRIEAHGEAADRGATFTVSLPLSLPLS